MSPTRVTSAVILSLAGVGDERSSCPTPATGLRTVGTDRRPVDTPLAGDAVLQPDRVHRLASRGSSPNSRMTARRKRRSHSQVRDHSMSSELPQDRPFVVIGIDVAKDKLDVHAWPTQQTLQVPNTPAGIDSLVAGLAPLRVSLIVIEATGRYERRVAFELMSQGYEVAIVN